MNYNVLRYFSVLAQVEHYTIAAARLGISQPSLSSAIHNLENELGGVRLFEKNGRNVRLTEEGRFYQEKVDAALKDCEKPLTVAVMGCVVNGPGEAREADIGIAGGDGWGMIFEKGVQVEKLPYEQLLPALLARIERL